MPTRSVLEQTFRVYFEEIDRCIQGKCYWALLHVLLVLPDICAAMETDNGETNRSTYKNWCERYLADDLVKPEDWYRMRCVILHQGRTLDDQSEYSAFAFGQPSTCVVHRCVKEDSHGKVLQLDVGEMAKEVRRAMAKWFDTIETSEHPHFVENFVRNADALVRSHDQPAMPIAVQMFVTSSPWPRS